VFALIWRLKPGHQRARKGRGRGHGEGAQKAGGGEEPGAQVPGPTQPQPPTLSEQNPTQKWYRLGLIEVVIFVLFSFVHRGVDNQSPLPCIFQGRGTGMIRASRIWKAL